MTQIFAPFTPEQVKALNDWQQRIDVHPFTCGLRGDHVREEDNYDPAESKLIATEAGWVCPFCDYIQNWAHDFMLRN